MNATTTVENATNDRVYLKDEIDSLKISTRAKLQVKVNEKELTLKNAKLLKGRQLVINSLESKIFPFRTANVATDDDYDEYFIYNHEMYHVEL